MWELGAPGPCDACALARSSEVPSTRSNVPARLRYARTAMHEPDWENWRAIDANTRPATWADFIGDSSSAVYLTPAGVGLSARMAHDLTAFTGPDWLSTAIGSGSQAGRIPWLGRFSPPLSLVGAEQGSAGAFIEVVRWWASLTSQAQKRGIGQVKFDTRRDVSIDRLLHTLTQTRLGAIAASLGLDVAYEPPGGGDVDLVDGAKTVTVEVFSMGTPQFVETQQQLADDMHTHLDTLRRTHDVHFRGRVPDTSTNLDAWSARVANDAEIVGRLRIALAVEWDGHELAIEPGDEGVGAMLDGSSIEGDVGSRLYKRAKAKARQIEGAADGWLWIENHGAVDMLSPIYYQPMIDQLAAYDDLLRPVLTEGVSSLRGLTFSGAGRRQWPPRPAQRATSDLLATERGPPARAMSQPLVLDRVRSSMHLIREQGDAGSLMWRLLEGEAEWLDRTLEDLDVVPRALDLIRPEFHPTRESLAD